MTKIPVYNKIGLIWIIVCLCFSLWIHFWKFTLKELSQLNTKILLQTLLVPPTFCAQFYMNFWKRNGWCLNLDEVTCFTQSLKNCVDILESSWQFHMGRRHKDSRSVCLQGTTGMKKLAKCNKLFKKCKNQTKKIWKSGRFMVGFAFAKQSIKLNQILFWLKLNTCV